MTAFTLILSGCGDAPPEDEPKGSEADKAKPSEVKSPLTQEEWNNLCGDGGLDPDSSRCTEDQLEPGEDDDEIEDDEMGVPADEEYHIGDEIRHNRFDDDHTIYHWDVKVTGVETADVLKNAADNPEYYSGDDLDAPEKLDATPEDGSTFVHITYETMNSSGVPDSLSLDAEVAVESGDIYAPLGDEYTDNLSEIHDLQAGNEQNPNSTAKGDWVLEVPKNSEVYAVVVTPTAIDADDEYWVFLD